jgi:hypothetical protein
VPEFTGFPPRASAGLPRTQSGRHRRQAHWTADGGDAEHSFHYRAGLWYSCSTAPGRCRTKRHTTLPLIGSRRERFAEAAREGVFLCTHRQTRR